MLRNSWECFFLMRCLLQRNVRFIQEELTILYFTVANGCRERRRSWTAGRMGMGENTRRKEEKRKRRGLKKSNSLKFSSIYICFLLFGFSEFPLTYGFCIIGVESSSFFARFSWVEWFPAFSTVDVGGAASNITFPAFSNGCMFELLNFRGPSGIFSVMINLKKSFVVTAERSRAVFTIPDRSVRVQLFSINSVSSMFVLGLGGNERELFFGMGNYQEFRETGTGCYMSVELFVSFRSFSVALSRISSSSTKTTTRWMCYGQIKIYQYICAAIFKQVSSHPGFL